VLVAGDGSVYFSDAMGLAPAPHQRSTDVDAPLHYDTFALSVYDFLRGRGDGRLLRYDPFTRRTTTLLSGLYFANGVALGPDQVRHDGEGIGPGNCIHISVDMCISQEYVLVAETFNARLIRYWLPPHPRAGSAEVFVVLDGCVPDGISASEDGTGFWVACYTAPTHLTAFAGNNPIVRTLVGALPTWMWPKGTPIGLVLRLDGRGRVMSLLADPEGRVVHGISAVTEWRGHLYLGQLSGNSVPIVPIRAA